MSGRLTARTQPDGARCTAPSLVDGYRVAGTAAALNAVAAASLGGAPAVLFVNLPANSPGAMLPPDVDLD